VARKHCQGLSACDGCPPIWDFKIDRSDGSFVLVHLRSWSRWRPLEIALAANCGCHCVLDFCDTCQFRLPTADSQRHVHTLYGVLFGSQSFSARQETVPHVITSRELCISWCIVQSASLRGTCNPGLSKHPWSGRYCTSGSVA
jgi:hypothetical protein